MQNPAGLVHHLHSYEQTTNLADPPAYRSRRAMYLLFLPPVLAFVGIFAISLRNVKKAPRLGHLIRAQGAASKLT